MTVLEYIIGGVLLLLAVALVVLISLQQSKRHGLGASIAGTGASESYLAKNGIAGKSKILEKATLAVAIAFVILVVALYIVGTIDNSEDADDTSSEVSAEVSTVVSEAVSEAESVAESVAETSAE